MKSTKVVLSLGAVSAVVTAFVISPSSSSEVRAANQAPAALNCNLTDYKASTGLTSALEGNVLTVSWNGQGTSQLRARFAIDGGTPTIRDLSARRGSGEWATLGQNLTPEYRVTTGVRRMSNGTLRTEPADTRYLIASSGVMSTGCACARGTITGWPRWRWLDGTKTTTKSSAPPRASSTVSRVSSASM